MCSTPPLPQARLPMHCMLNQVPQLLHKCTASLCCYAKTSCLTSQSDMYLGVPPAPAAAACSFANSLPAAFEVLRPLPPAPPAAAAAAAAPPTGTFCLPSVGVRLPAGGEGKPGNSPPAAAGRDRQTQTHIQAAEAFQSLLRNYKANRMRRHLVGRASLGTTRLQPQQQATDRHPKQH